VRVADAYEISEDKMLRLVSGYPDAHTADGGVSQRDSGVAGAY